VGLLDMESHRVVTPNCHSSARGRVVTMGQLVSLYGWPWYPLVRIWHVQAGAQTDLAVIYSAGWAYGDLVWALPNSG